MSVLKNCFNQIGTGANILDVGCLGFRQVEIAKELGFNDLNHFGVDYCEPENGLPAGFVFRKVDLSSQSIPFKDDMFDLVVASHIIEHTSNPVEFFGECTRVCKPGGLMYFESPSERSLLLPSMPFEHDKFFSLSFFDDPTHISRPWTPQALYRLSRYFSCEPIKTGYLFSWKHRLLFPVLIIYALLTRSGKRMESYCWAALGWSCYITVRKPLDIRGRPSFYYYIPKNR